jgi:X-Pro dipeptidyl-peptidase (S15 family)
MDADRVMVELDVPARMRDGVTPRAHVYRPEGDGLWPVLLERTPYGRDQPQLLAWLEPVATARKGFIVGLQDTAAASGPKASHRAGRILVLGRDGVVEPNLVWKDTVLVRTGETVDILLESPASGYGWRTATSPSTTRAA